MKSAAATTLRVALFAVAAALYYWLSHVYTSADRPSTEGALLSLAPYMAVALVMAWRATRRALALGLWALAALALLAAGAFLRNNFAWLYLLQHAGAFTLLAIGFGRTLLAGQVPMISGFAERVHGALAPELARYTRGATLAWTVFFGAMVATSLLLFFAAPIQWWSVFANLLTPLLIALMFLVEYLVRRRLPPEYRTGLVASIRATLGHRHASPPPDCELRSLHPHVR